MKKLEQLSRYDFHDSLLENIFYDKEQHRVILKIDFCNWKQNWYTEENEETSIIFLVFENTSNISFPEISLNSDEIIHFNLLKINEEVSGIELIAFNDVTNTYYTIIINADSVTVTNIDIFN